MARVVVSTVAQADAHVVLRDLAEKGGYRVVADYAFWLERLYDRLASYPDSGAPRPLLGPHIRMAVLSPYLIFYRHVPGSNLVGVVRVLHSSRHITRKLLAGAD
jgi:toxin ParE1/3/4